jgi:hypothetical protein
VKAVHERFEALLPSLSEQELEILSRAFERIAATKSDVATLENELLGAITNLENSHAGPECGADDTIFGSSHDLAGRLVRAFLHSRNQGLSVEESWQFIWRLRRGLVSPDNRVAGQFKEFLRSLR